MPNPTDSTDPFDHHVPPSAVAYCRRLWREWGFSLRVTRPRRTRLGTHQFDPAAGHLVTVNANLGPEAFLITYLHEVAHVVTVRQSRRRPQPHGAAWKRNFRTLLEPVLTEEIFCPAVLRPLRVYALNPTAATSSYPPLAQALQGLEHPPEGTTTVAQLPEGEAFVLHNRTFVRGPLRRTRALCTEATTGRKYTVPGHAQVRKSPQPPKGAFQPE